MMTYRTLYRRGPATAIAALALAASVTACSAQSNTESGAATSSTSPVAGSIANSDVTGNGSSPSADLATGVPTDGSSTQDGQSAVGGGPSAAAASTTIQTSGPSRTAGNIEDTVAAQVPTTLPPVAIDAPADFGNGVTLKVDKVEPMDVQARVPGEISGPAVVIDLSVSNGSSSAIGLDSVAVNVITVGNEPVPEISTDPAKPLSGVLDAGKTTSGKYVFLLPEDQRNEIQLSVQYAADSGIVTLTGDV